MDKADKIYIFGHKNPDTDSICSSIVYSRLKKALGYENALPYRLGKINKETEYILKKFGTQLPELLEDVKIRVKDLSLYKPITLSKSDPIQHAIDYLNTRKGSRLIPVIDNKGMLEGVVSLGDITRVFMENVINDEYILKYDIVFDNLIEILNAKKVYGDYNYKMIEGNLYVGSSILNKIEDFDDKDVIITAKLDTARKFVYEHQVGAVILADDLDVSEFVGSKTAIIVVKRNIYNTLALINRAISIGSIMKKDNLFGFSINEYLDDIIDIIKTSSHRNFPVFGFDKKLEGVLSRRHLLDIKKRKVILIDHNETNQSVEGIEEAEIIEIIDHHRIADVQTESPLYIRAEPVGCTATIVYKMYLENAIPIDESSAGLLLSAILSDTLIFTSPTCTIDDVRTAKVLAPIAGVFDIEQYAYEMFAAGSVVESLSALEILTTDLKIFNMGNFKISISQINSMDYKSIVKKRDELLEAMDMFIQKEELDLVLLMVTDIIRKGSEILIAGTPRARAFAAEAFSYNPTHDIVFLSGVVSRKKQMIPKLTMASQRI